MHNPLGKKIQNEKQTLVERDGGGGGGSLVSDVDGLTQTGAGKRGEGGS